MAEPANTERADRIKELRKARGVTQPVLAELVGVSDRTVQVWEAGGNIETANLAELARVLNTTPLYIQTGAMREPSTSEELLNALADRLEKMVEGDRRTGGGMRGSYQEVSALIKELRGDEDVSLSSLRADVRALSKGMRDLTQAVRELQRQQRARDRSDTGDSQQEAPGGQ